MELRQLEYFVAVVEEASFTHAADRVRISQSGVSAQIRQLEKELGTALIDRTSRRTGVTAAGAAALEHARAALAQVEALRTAVGEVNGLIRGRLAVGMVTGCTIAPFFDVLAAFHGEYPGVQLVLGEDRSDRLLAQVRSGEVDLALIAVAGHPPADLGSVVVTAERLVAMAPPGHPLTGRGPVRVHEVAGFPVVCLPQGTGIRTVLERACAAAGVRLTVTFQASAPAAVADLARRGFGVAILSESMVRAFEDRLVGVPLKDADEPAVLALVWNPAATAPALHRLLPHAKAAFTGTAPVQDSRDSQREGAASNPERSRTVLEEQ